MSTTSIEQMRQQAVGCAVQAILAESFRTAENADEGTVLADFVADMGQWLTEQAKSI